MCFGPMKREAGGSPARTRRCKKGVLLRPQRIALTEDKYVFGKRKQNVELQVRRPAWNVYYDCEITVKRPRGFGWYEKAEIVVRLFVMPNSHPGSFFHV